MSGRGLLLLTQRVDRANGLRRQRVEDVGRLGQRVGHDLGEAVGGQEIGREINTLGSNANHAEIQKLVVMMKDDLEKIKEQTLNVL